MYVSIVKMSVLKNFRKTLTLTNPSSLDLCTSVTGMSEFLKDPLDITCGILLKIAEYRLRALGRAFLSMRMSQMP